MSSDAKYARNAVLDAYHAECCKRRGCPSPAFVQVLQNNGTSFALRAQPVPDADMESIAAVLKFSSVSELVLREIRLSAQTWLFVLQECSQMPLKVVLAGCKLGECNQLDIARAIGALQATQIDLSATDISDEFLSTLATTPLLAPGSPCHTLNLSNNRITDASVSALAQQLRACGARGSLRSLALAYNLITDVGALALADVICADAAAGAVSAARLPGTWLEHIDLEGNHVGDGGAAALAAAVARSCAVVSLRFSYNSMESDAQMMSQWSGALQNSALEVLELASSYPKPGAVVTDLLIAATKSPRLRLLDVRGAALEGDSVRAACELISSGCPLEVLRITVVDTESGHAVAQAVETRGAPLDITITGPVDQADMLRLKLARFGGGSARGTPLGHSFRASMTFDSVPEAVTPGSALAAPAFAWRHASEDDHVFLPHDERACDENSEVGVTCGTVVSARWPRPGGSVCETTEDETEAARSPLVKYYADRARTLGGGAGARRNGSQPWQAASISNAGRAPGPQRKHASTLRCRSAETPPVAAHGRRQAPTSPLASLAHAALHAADAAAGPSDSLTPSLKPRLHCTRPRAFALGGAEDAARHGRLSGLSSGGGAERAALAFLKADEFCKGKIGRQHVARALQELGLFEGLNAKQLGRVLEKDAKLSNPNYDGAFTFPEFLVCFERLERWHAQQQRQGRILAHSGPATVPPGWANNATLRKSFRNFCMHGKSRADKVTAQHSGLSSQQWAKLCRDSGLLEPDGPLPVFSIDVIFVTCKPASQRHLQFNTFLDALAIVSREANMTFEEVASKLGCRRSGNSAGSAASAAADGSNCGSVSVRTESLAAADQRRPLRLELPGGGADEVVVTRVVERVLSSIEPRQSALADRLQQVEEMVSAGKEDSGKENRALGDISALGGKNQVAAPSIAAAVRSEVSAAKAELMAAFKVMLEQSQAAAHASAAQRSASSDEINELKGQIREQSAALVKLQHLLDETSSEARAASKALAALQEQGHTNSAKAVKTCVERQGRLEGAIMQIASRIDLLDASLKALA